ncbi:MAG: zf-HC2 domain-containing protein [Deltaproteobacteria bacterium]|nr:zf-HC2 domain-containing protein [Deltaproteobacteria bacterium]
MRCTTARKHISLDMDGRLTQDEAAALVAHLAACAECRREREAMGQAWTALGALPEITSTPDDWRAIAARLEGRRGMSGWLNGGWSWLEELWFAAPRRWALATVMSACVLAGVAAGARMSRELAPQPPLEALALAEAFGEFPAAGWIAVEGSGAR